MTLTVADRRAIATRALFDPAFRTRLGDDPKAAVAEQTGRTLPEDQDVELIEENERDWAFVFLEPAAIDRDLPPASDLRWAVENQVYALVRDDPEAAQAARRDPVAFLRERCDIDVNSVHLVGERDGAVAIVLPNHASHELLPDSALDMVAGGGDPYAQSGSYSNPYEGREAKR